MQNWRSGISKTWRRWNVRYLSAAVPKASLFRATRFTGTCSRIVPYLSICGSDRRLRVPGYSQKERAYWLVLPVFNGQSLHPRKLAHIVTDHRETIGQRNCRNLHVVRPDSRPRLFQLRALFAVDYCSRIVKWHAVEFCHELAKQGEVLT